MRRVTLLFGLALIVLADYASAAIYVARQNGIIGLYDFDGSVIDSTFILQSNFGGLALSGNDLYASRLSTIDRYDATTGAPVSVPFISGLSTAWDLCVSGNTLYSAFLGNSTVGKYNAATGAPIAVPFFSVAQPYGVIESGGRVYVAAESQSTTTGRIAVYNASTGAVINPNLVTGLYRPHGLALWNGNVYVSQQNGAVGVYDALTGAVVSANLISGPVDILEDIAIHNGLLYVTYNGLNKVAVFDAVTGATINANLINGVIGARGIVVVPEPAALGLITVAGITLARRRRA